MWGFVPGGRLTSACYAGPTWSRSGRRRPPRPPSRAGARLQGRRCSSIVGPAEAVAQMWELLRPYWGQPREIREAQPVMAISGPPRVAADPHLRRVRSSELDVLLPASVAMFTEEVGVSPLGPDGGVAYRARVAELIALGRAFARIEDGRVMFKAEIGAVTPHACQVQGVWVRPELRGQGLAVAGMAAVVSEALRSIAPMVSLYVNDFNARARAGVPEGRVHRGGHADVHPLLTVRICPVDRGNRRRGRAEACPRQGRRMAGSPGVAPRAKQKPGKGRACRRRPVPAALSPSRP